MSVRPAVPTSAALPEEVAAVRGRALRVGSRMMLGANVSLQLAFLFAFLYLRANNLGGMWHPDGIDPPPLGLGASILGVQFAGLVILWLGLRGVSRTSVGSALTVLLGAALVVNLGATVLRVYQLFHLGWTMDQGSYVAVSLLWLFVIAFEMIIGSLWLISLFAGVARRTLPVGRGQLLALTEYWGFVGLLSLLVFGLVQYAS